eukprot:CFRG2388T1
MPAPDARNAAPTSHLNRLTLPKVAEFGGQDIRELKTLVASNQGFEVVDDLSPCVEIRKITLSKNKIKSLECVKWCKSLTYLNVANNNIDSLMDLKDLKMLSVINAGGNNLMSADGATSIEHLKALVLNNNKFTQTPNFLRLKKLNTLVLSHNMIEDVKAVRYLTALTKFSASHNKIRNMPDVTGLYDLVEIKMNDNLIVTVPESIQFAPNLKTLDLGNNRIKKFSDVKHLANLPVLKQLTLRGNPIADSADYREQIAELIPTVEVLDGERFRGRKFVKTLNKAAKEKRDNRLAAASGNSGAKIQSEGGGRAIKSDDNRISTDNNGLNGEHLEAERVSGTKVGSSDAHHNFEEEKVKLGLSGGEAVPEVNARRKFVGKKVRLGGDDDEVDNRSPLVKNPDVTTYVESTVTRKSQPSADGTPTRNERSGVENMATKRLNESTFKSKNGVGSVASDLNDTLDGRHRKKTRVADDFFVSMSGERLQIDKTAPKPVTVMSETEKAARRKERSARKEKKRKESKASSTTRDQAGVHDGQHKMESSNKMKLSHVKETGNTLSKDSSIKTPKPQEREVAEVRAAALTGVLKVERKTFTPSVDVNALFSELGKADSVAFGEGDGSGWD